MENAKTTFSLRWRILAWFFVNLLVLGAVLFFFLRVQFRVGINSLLAGPTSDRLETLAQPLAAELRQLPESGWNAALGQTVAVWRARGLRAALFHDDGTYAAGDIRELPDDVLRTITQHEARNHRMMPPPHRGGDAHPHPHGGPHDDDDDGDGHHPHGPPPGGEHHHPPPDGGMGPPPDDRGGPMPGHDGDGRPPGATGGPPAPPDAQSVGPLEKFMIVTGDPRMYWAGVHLGEIRHTGHGRSPSVTLLLASDSLRGGGLFFDYVPWLALGGGLVLISVLMWLPFVHRLTRSLARMTHVAEQIAQGRFEPPHVSARRDELGRLSRALGHMAARLEGFVTGQKRFLGDTAHELLSPLARLEVALSIIEQKCGAAGDGQYAGRALDEVRHISTLVHELLSFTKAGLRSHHVKLEPAPLAALARQAVEREAAGDKVTVEIPEDLRVCVVPDLLVRAISNVVRNAIRYAGDAGPIRVSAAPGHDADNADTVTIHITDEGPGVPPDAIDRLFDPFFRPETARTRETGGIGLGLAIVKSCVEACDGQVAVANRTPFGLELTITLPMAD